MLAVRRSGERAQQSVATEEISQNITAAADGAAVISSTLEEVSHATREAQSSAEIVLDASRTVEETVIDLRREVEEFLQRVVS